MSLPESLHVVHYIYIHARAGWTKKNGFNINMSLLVIPSQFVCVAVTFLQWITKNLCLTGRDS